MERETEFTERSFYGNDHTGDLDAAAGAAGTRADKEEQHQQKPCPAGEKRKIGAGKAGAGGKRGHGEKAVAERRCKIGKLPPDTEADKESGRQYDGQENPRFGAEKFFHAPVKKQIIRTEID